MRVRRSYGILAISQFALNMRIRFLLNTKQHEEVFSNPKCCTCTSVARSPGARRQGTVRGPQNQ